MQKLDFAGLDRARQAIGVLRRARALSEPDAEADRTCGEWLQHCQRMLVNHPLVRSHIARVSCEGARNVTGWHAIAEQRALELTLTLAGRPELEIESPYSGHPIVNAARLVWRLEAAHTYLWLNDMFDHVRKSPPLPAHVISRKLLPYPIMFWSFETAWTLKSHQLEDGRQLETNWWLLSDEETGCNHTLDMTTHDGRVMRVVEGGIAYGKRWPDDFCDLEEGQRTTVELILKMMAFLASPYVTSESERLPRGIRRDLAHRGQAAESETLVSTVRLRRASTQSNVTKSETASKAGERHHHWWVSGHFRAQWYPSQQAHKVIWIAPHLQGDLDKPLLEKTYAVVR